MNFSVGRSIACLALSFQAVVGMSTSSFAQPHGRSIHTSSVSSAQALRDIPSLEVMLQKLEGHTSTPVITALAGSPDGKYIAVAGDDHAIRIILAESGETVQTVLGHHDWIQSLVFAYSSSAIESSDVEASVDHSSVDLPSADRPSVDSTVPDLYSAGHDGRVLRWKFTFPLEAQEVAIVPYAIRSISVSSEKQLLAIGGFSDEVLLYDLAAGQYVKRLRCATADQRCVRFSPDGSRVLAGSRDGEILVWDTTSGDAIAQYREHQSRIHTAAFSADAKWVTSAGEDRRLVRYDLSQKAVVWNHELALSKLMSLCLINDQLVAVAGADNGIRLFDAQSNLVIAEMQGHLGTVAVMAACGDSLASGSFDTTVRVWSLTALEDMRVQRNIPTSRTPIKIDTQVQIR